MHPLNCKTTTLTICWVLGALPALQGCVDDGMLGDGNAYGTGDETGDETGACFDDNEPNESESTAKSLRDSTVSDCDGSGGSVMGTLSGAADVDWYFYEGNDTFWCFVEPRQSISQSGAGIRICQYIICLAGTPDFYCPAGTTDDTSPEGVPGCCSDEGFEVQLDCAGSSDASPLVYIRVDQPNADADTCNEYSLSYDL